jgi:hypothetical protein
MGGNTQGPFCALMQIKVGLEEKGQEMPDSIKIQGELTYLCIVPTVALLRPKVHAPLSYICIWKIKLFFCFTHTMQFR